MHLLFALLVSSALTGRCLAESYVFSYSFLPPVRSTGYYSISVPGTLAVGAQDSVAGGYSILSMTGTRTVDGVDMQITGLLPTFGPISFYGNDNLLFYPGPPVVDYNGLSFSVDNLPLSDDGLGDVNVYFDSFSGMYTGPINGVNPGSFDVSPMPEPSTTVVLISGLLALALKQRPLALLQSPVLIRISNEEIAPRQTPSAFKRRDHTEPRIGRGVL